jgi:hypothetical protein
MMQMSYKLKLVGTFDDPFPRGHFRFGDCFFWNVKESPTLNDHYKSDWKASRLPVIIFTPGGWWSPDQRYFGDGGWHGAGWKVFGLFPLITATPSINFPGFYHGWLQDGGLSDDIEGRRFDENQNLIISS